MSSPLALSRRRLLAGAGLALPALYAVDALATGIGAPPAKPGMPAMPSCPEAPEEGIWANEAVAGGWVRVRLRSDCLPGKHRRWSMSAWVNLRRSSGPYEAVALGEIGPWRRCVGSACLAMPTEVPARREGGAIVATFLDDCTSRAERSCNTYVLRARQLPGGRLEVQSHITYRSGGRIDRVATSVGTYRRIG